MAAYPLLDALRRRPTTLGSPLDGTSTTSGDGNNIHQNLSVPDLIAERVAGAPKFDPVALSRAREAGEADVAPITAKTHTSELALPSDHGLSLYDAVIVTSHGG